MIELKEKTSQDSYELKLEQIATQLLWEMGIQPKLKGYTCLRLAIISSTLQPELRCTQLYGMIAERYHRKPKSVEAVIRYAIIYAFDKNLEQMQAFFPYPITEPPGNWEVIALAADRIRLRM